MATNAHPTYSQIIGSVNAAINEQEKLAILQPETQKMWVLEAQQEITTRVKVIETRVLRLISNQEINPYQDTTGVISGLGTVTTAGTTLTGASANGTGTITTSTNSTTVAGSGTAFITQLVPGQLLIVGGEQHEVVSIQSNTSLTLDVGFSTNLTNSAFQYSTTRFYYDLVTGSNIVVNSIPLQIASISAENAAILVSPPATDQTNQAFTVDTYVQEMPMRMLQMISNDRVENGYHRQIKIFGVEQYDAIKTSDVNAVYNSYDIPHVLTVKRTTGGNYQLMTYPTADHHKEVTMTAKVRILPRFYQNDSITANIQLDENHEPAIRTYVEAMTWGWLKDQKMKLQKMAEFEKKLEDLHAYPINQVTYDAHYY